MITSNVLGSIPFILNLDENAKQFEFRVSYAVLYKLDIFAKWNSIGIKGRSA